MALPLHTDTLESVPEPFRSEYSEADGKFHLNVDGLDGLKSALHKERDTNKAIKQLGKTIEEIVAALGSLTTLTQQSHSIAPRSQLAQRLGRLRTKFVRCRDALRFGSASSAASSAALASITSAFCGGALSRSAGICVTRQDSTMRAMSAAVVSHALPGLYACSFPCRMRRFNVSAVAPGISRAA